MKRKNNFFGTLLYHFTLMSIHTKRKRKQQQQKRENQIEQGKQEKQDKQIIETPSTDLAALVVGYGMAINIVEVSETVDEHEKRLIDRVK